MGLFDWVFGQFIDVIEWTDDSQDTMIYHFPRYNNEIKYGAKLTVRESQMAIFVNEGIIADILEPGVYKLETKNLPIMSAIEHWDHTFKSPFKAEVYFVNTKRFTDLKWGTKNPIMVRDPEFSMVRLRAFGTYDIRITDPQQFMSEIVGTDSHFTVDEIDEQLTNLIISKFTTILGESQIPILDMASNYEKFSEYISKKIAPYFGEYGLSLTKILVENISLPNEVEQALNKRTSREITGNLDDNIKHKTAETLGSRDEESRDEVIGMDLEIAMGQTMADSLSSNKIDKNTPPPLPKANTIEYYAALNDEREGPYDIRTIQHLIKEGKLLKETLIWREGLADWVEASTILEKYFKATPPPLSKR